MEEPSGKPASHLSRVFRVLVLVGSVCLVLGLIIQLAQLSSYGGRGQQALDGYAPILVAQFLMVIGPVALTGAMFALVLLAVGKDRDAEEVAGRARSDRDLFE